MNEPKNPPLKKDTGTLYCSFCNKAQHEVRKLIAGPKVLICDECIDTCNEIIGEAKFELARTEPVALLNYVELQRKYVDASLNRINGATQLLRSLLAPTSETVH